MRQILLSANLKRHLGSLAGISFLVFLSALFLTGVLAVWKSASDFEMQELKRLGYGDLTAWVSGEETVLSGLAAELEGQETVASVRVQPLLFADYEINGQDSDSEGQLVLYEPSQVPYRFFDEDLRGYTDAPESIGGGEIYLPASLISMYGVKNGDEIRFSIARQGGELALTAAGFFEDPFMGSSMIGMKSFLVSEEVLAEAGELLAGAGIDGLAKEGGMIHITAADDSLSAAELNRQLYENTSLAAYTDFLYSADTISGFMMTLQNVFTGFLLAFVVILLAVAFVVIGYSMGSGMERDRKNIGILKTMGITGGQLKTLWLFQYLIPVFVGITVGSLAAVPLSRQAGFLMVSTTGVWIRPAVPLGLWAGSMLFLLLLIGGFIYAQAGKISRITPMEAIRTAAAVSRPRKGMERLLFRFPLKKEQLELRLALRQLLDGKRRYVSVCLTALLLVFFASMAGRLDVWLGSEGQGLMDAFNPADLDLAVQPVNEVDMNQVESLIEQYSQITGRYSLAMPDVAVEGIDYTANVITEPERFHILSGRTIETEQEIVVTEFVAADMGIAVGDTVSVAYQGKTERFTVAGIYQCANEMGANIGMSREGFARIGTETANMWCRHYFLRDSTQKEAIMTALEASYGSALYIHENSWPGLAGILAAMKLLLLVLYLTAAFFVMTVTVLTGSRLLIAEQRDMGIYRSMGYSSGKLRRSFAARFGIAALTGAVGGILAGGFFTDSLVGLALRSNGISNFHSRPGILAVLFPAVAVTGMFWGFACLYAGKVKRIALTILAAGE